MTWHLSDWSLWTTSAFWTAVTLGAAYAAGHILNAFVLPRLTRLAARTRGTWDDVVASELKRRLPTWALLFGAWASLGYWSFEPRVDAILSGALFVLAAISVTFTIAGASTRMLVDYGRALAPAVPVTGLTRNLISIVIAILGTLVVLNRFGVSITPMLTALGVGGLAVALALQEPLSNLFAGLFLTLAGQIRIGDYVKIDAASRATSTTSTGAPPGSGCWRTTSSWCRTPSSPSRCSPTTACRTRTWRS